jgi:hypothetical protein
LGVIFWLIWFIYRKFPGINEFNRILIRRHLIEWETLFRRHSLPEHILLLSKHGFDLELVELRHSLGTDAPNVLEGFLEEAVLQHPENSVEFNFY